MTNALKAFRYYRKNKNYYSERVAAIFGDDDALSFLYEEVASKFGATGSELERIVLLSYNRSVDRAFGIRGLSYQEAKIINKQII
jgi:hypothetical protein